MNFKCAGISDSMNDGEGIALDIFFQGCSMRCPGCQNPDLQNHTGGFDVDTGDVISYMKRHEDFYCSLVFLGGEPLEQEEALFDLASRSGLYNVLYTGWLYEKIPQRIIDLMDKIIDGPYIKEMETNGFPASSNQRIFYKKR